MSAARAEEKADDARAALLSDIQELKSAEQRAVAKAHAVLPWVIGAAVGALAIGVLIALKPRRRSFGPQRRSRLGKLARGAALSALGLVTRRLVTSAVDRALPERPVARPAVPLVAKA